jgi:hypothetical protein
MDRVSTGAYQFLPAPIPVISGGNALFVDQKMKKARKKPGDVASFHEAVAADLAGAQPQGRDFYHPNVLGDPEGDHCRQFRMDYAGLSLSQLNPLYAMPDDLLEEIVKLLPDLLLPDEMRFESALTTFGTRHRCLGIVDDTLIRNSILMSASMPQISQEIFEKLRWGAVMTLDQANSSLEVASGRMDPLREQAQGYLGWLMTNPQFLAEVKSLRVHRDRRRTKCSFRRQSTEKREDKVLRSFLDRWKLSGFASWELPIPQGPNFTGIHFPGRDQPGGDSIHLDLPITTPLQARYPLRQIIEEARQQATPPHLSQWLKALQRSSNGKGPTHYQRMLQLQFYRNIVFGSRYGDRLARRVEKLDKVFAEFIGLGVDEIKKLRLAIAQSLPG